MNGPRQFSPFEQIPSIDGDGFVLSESAEVVLYMAKKSARLIPIDLDGEAQLMRWRIAASSSLQKI